MSIIKMKTNIMKIIALIICVVITTGIATYNRGNDYQASASKSINEIGRAHV